MTIATLSLLLASVVTGTASMPQPAAPQRDTLQCAVALRTAADMMRETQGDSADARALTMSASAAEDRYRRQAASQGLNPLQVEIALAAERDARHASVDQIDACLGQKTALAH